MSNQHTPGPWTWGWAWDEGEFPIDIVAFPHRGGVAELHLIPIGHASTREIVEANAHLIAAAPDLLEALEELVDIVEAHRSGCTTIDSFTTQPARLAIAKAKGGS